MSTQEKEKVLIHSHPAQTADYQATRYSLDGERFISVPVVMMIEGVRNGSAGPILHLAEELQKSAQQWDGTPVTIAHPQINGEFVSVNDAPDCVVGHITGARVEGKKLKGYAVMKEQQLISISPQANEAIQNNEPLDVSIGVFTINDDNPGEYNGIQYESIARQYRPDHLALLPGERGACSWEDGCGIRVNTSANHSKNQIVSFSKIVKNELMENEKTIQAIKDMAKKGFSIIQANVKGFQEKMSMIQNKLDAMDIRSPEGNSIAYHMLEEVFDGYFIYRKREPEGSKLYRQSYQMNAEDQVEFTGEPVSVRKDVNYVQVNQFSTNHKTEGGNMSEKKPSACLIKKVDAVINHELTQFAEDDREFLLTQSESVLEKFIPKEPAKKEETPQMNAEQAMELLRNSFKKPEDFLKVLPEEMQDQMRSGLALHKEQRTQLVDVIIANTEEGTWNKDELEGMDTAMLKKISKSVVTNKEKQENDFSGMNGGGADPEVQANQKHEEEPLGLPQLNFKPKK